MSKLVNVNNLQQLVDLNEDEIQQLEYMPTIFSSGSDEFIDENGKATYTMRLFEEDLPELTTEEEVEILYKILTKKELFLNTLKYSITIYNQ
jgi:hypothetical protein